MNQLLRQMGMALFFAAYTPDISRRKVYRAIRQVIDDALKGGASTGELEKVRRATLTNRVFEFYSAEQVSQRLGFSETVEGDYRLWIRRLEALREISADTVRSVAARYLDPKAEVVLSIRPRKTNPALYIAGLARRLIPTA